MKNKVYYLCGDIMKKEEYVAKISSELNMTKKDVALVVDAFVKEIINNIESKDSVTITNFGTFKKDHIKAKNMFSPIDGLNVRNDYYRIHFSMSESFSKRLNKK